MPEAQICVHYIAGFCTGSLQLQPGARGPLQCQKNDAMALLRPYDASDAPRTDLSIASGCMPLSIQAVQSMCKTRMHNYAAPASERKASKSSTMHCPAADTMDGRVMLLLRQAAA